MFGDHNYTGFTLFTTRVVLQGPKINSSKFELYQFESRFSGTLILSLFVIDHQKLICSGNGHESHFRANCPGSSQVLEESTVAGCSDLGITIMGDLVASVRVCARCQFLRNVLLLQCTSE